jgi:hypothetical protein
VERCQPVPVAAQSKLQVFGSSHAWIADSNPAGSMDVLSLGSVVCCQVEVFLSADLSSREVQRCVRVCR